MTEYQSFMPWQIRPRWRINLVYVLVVLPVNIIKCKAFKQEIVPYTAIDTDKGNEMITFHS